MDSDKNIGKQKDTIENRSQPSEQNDSEKQKWQSKFSNIQNNPGVQRAKGFLTTYTKEVISGICMFLGLVWSFFGPIGNVLVATGFVICCFSDIHGLMWKIKDYFAKNTVVKNVIWCGLLCYLLFKMPMFIISLLGVSVVMSLFFGDKGSSSKDSNKDNN